MQNEQNAAFVSSHKQLQNHGSVLTKTEKKTTQRITIYSIRTSSISHKHRFPSFQAFSMTGNTDIHTDRAARSSPVLLVSQTLSLCHRRLLRRFVFSRNFSSRSAISEPLFSQRQIDLYVPKHTHTHTDTNSHKPQKTIALRTSANWFQ